MTDVQDTTFDHIVNWLTESPAQERYLWVFDFKTKEISWKNRNAYSCWTGTETARLQEIFKQMSDQLPDRLEAQDKEQLKLLIDLRRRVTKSYEGFLKAHDSFFGLIYQFLFAFYLSDYYEDLSKKLEVSLSASLANLDITTLSPGEIESVAKLIDEKSLYPSLEIDWEALSMEQFQTACKLACYAKPLTLDTLDKEKITYFLDADVHKINQFSAEEIERNIHKIELRFIAFLDATKASLLDMSNLELDYVIEILKRVSSTLVNLDFLDLSFFSAEDVSAILKENPNVLNKFPAATVAANLSLIEVKYYKHFSDAQLEALNYSQLTGEQFMHLPGYSYAKDKHVKELDLNNFTAAQISKVFQYQSSLIQKLSPRTVSNNLSKLDSNFMRSLSPAQVEALDFALIQPEQLTQLPTSHVTKKQWHKIDLSQWSTPAIAKMLEENPSLLQQFSPSTVSANLSRIATRFYYRITDDQLKEIDYRTLNDVQKEAFTAYKMERMKNYPQARRSGHYYQFGGGKWEKEYYSDFFGSTPYSPQKQKPFGGFYFGMDDDSWWEQFFKPYGATPRANVGPSPAQNEKLKAYHACLNSACALISKNNKINANPLYEKIRQKCLNRKNELTNEPKLIFVDEVKRFDPSKIREYYKKQALVFHPDKNQDNLEEAKELFQLLSEAYKFLSDANK